MATDKVGHWGMEVVAMTFQRITVDPAVCAGKPCIRGLRFPVSRLLGLLASGETAELILRSYPYLEPEDIQEALSYAAFLADEQIVEFA
jgi:uncharacterized protein (DUF433 family)